MPDKANPTEARIASVVTLIVTYLAWRAGVDTGVAGACATVVLVEVLRASDEDIHQ